MTVKHPYKDHSDDCELIDGYGPDRQDCSERHTHLIVSHEYPTPNIVKSCWNHVLIQASQLGMSTFTVVDVRMREAMDEEAKAEAESRAEDEWQDEPF